MAYLFNYGNFNRLVSIFTMVAFSSSALVAVHPQHSKYDVNINDVIFVTNLMKSIKKLKKSKSKDSKKITKYGAEILTEVESYFNVRLNIEEGMKEVKRKMKEENLHELLVHLDPISKMVKKAVKKERKNRSQRANEVMEFSADELVMDADFQELNDLNSRGKDKDKNTPKKIPSILTLSVTAALVGVFLSVLPIPQVQAAGAALIAWGLGEAATVICQAIDEKEEEEISEEIPRISA